MVLRDLDYGEPHAVGVFDPHLDQSPGLPSGRSGDRHSGVGEPLVFMEGIPHLEPEFEPRRRLLGKTRALERAVVQEVDGPAMLRCAELR